MPSSFTEFDRPSFPAGDEEAEQTIKRNKVWKPFLGSLCVLSSSVLNCITVKTLLSSQGGGGLFNLETPERANLRGGFFTASNDKDMN